MPLSTHRPPSVEILVRTYHGDEQQLRDNLLPTLRIFVNRREFRFTAILDEESSADHTLGDQLSREGICDRVIYEALPRDWKRLFQGVAFPPPYNRWGYDRQQWSTFYMDAHSDRDVLGVVDSDATFYSYLTRKNIFSADGRINLTVCRPSSASPWKIARMLARSEHGCAYRNDKVALGEESPYECMMNNRMPIWFWRSTFAACRNHIARHWQVSFDAAYENFSRAPYCAFNILANYAIRHEPEKYCIHLMDAPAQDVVSVCQNGCLAPVDMVAGGLRTFRVAQTEQLPEPIQRAYPDLLSDTVHLNRQAHLECGVTIDQAAAERHYAAVREDLDTLTDGQRNAMRDAFLEFVNGDNLLRVKVVAVQRFSLRARMEWEIKYLFRKHPRLKAAALRLVALAAGLRRRWTER